MAFSELIKSFDKIRDYMRDFYIYGFKARGDFSAKSARTYDNEKRRIESYLAPYVRWESGSRGKRVYVSLDTSGIGRNPLYNAWRAKCFTDNDITLHFAILSALRAGRMGIAELTDTVCALTGAVFETQTVRLKANEYVTEGILQKEQTGRTAFYALSSHTLSALPGGGAALLDAVCFFQETAPFGFVGSTLLDRAGRTNDLFGFKHHYIVHTLEDGILLTLLGAMEGGRSVRFTQQSARTAAEVTVTGVPLRIFVSVQSGRRYVCLYNERNRRFQMHRLDYIKRAEALAPFPDYAALRSRLEAETPFCWGVSFGGAAQRQSLRMTLHIDEEREGYVLDRLKREGRGGEITHIGKDTFLYTREVFDMAEMMAWVKSFTGRIIALEGSGHEAVARFYRDMKRMVGLYGGGT